MSRLLYGYAGKILRVDLTGSTFCAEPTENFIPTFLGGKGINQWILFKELGRWVTPYEPENIICFGAGALVGTLVPGASRINIDSKNAFTGGIGSGNAGGWFGAELKFAGYDNIVIQGKAKEPVYLWIENDRVVLKPAHRLWGRTVSETEKLIREDLGQEDVQILCIGPAGENIVRSASIVVSGCRVAARCGLGAIMGSKNLKAIVVRGTGGIGVKAPNEFITLVETISQRLRKLEEGKFRKEFGTFYASAKYNDISALPYKNYYDEYIPDESFAKISHEVFHTYEVNCYACTACPTPCGHSYRINPGPFVGQFCLKAESNAIWDFGGRLAVEDAGAILRAQEECCQLGLDIDSTAGTIGWAIDCFQNKILTTKDTDGLNLNWGDHAVIEELLKKIAFREGFGNILAEGSFMASQIVGKGSDKYAIHIKGQDLVEGIRGPKGWALGVVVSARGGTHTKGAPVTENRRYSEEESEKLFGVKTAGDPKVYKDKPKIVVYTEYICCLLDSLGVCFFTGTWASPHGMSPGELTQFYSFATGVEISETELMKIAERIQNVEKMFNVYHAGFTRKDDLPPDKFFLEPIKSGPLKGELLQRDEWNEMLDEYYDLHGWDRDTSWPNNERLEELKLYECFERLGQVKQIHKTKN